MHGEGKRERARTHGPEPCRQAAVAQCQVRAGASVVPHVRVWSLNSSLSTSVVVAEFIVFSPHVICPLMRANLQLKSEKDHLLIPRDN